MIAAKCPCGCGHDLADREGQLCDQKHSELVFQGKPPLPYFTPGVGHDLSAACPHISHGWFTLCEVERKRRKCVHEWEYDEEESKGPWTGYIERCKHCGALQQVPQ